MTLRDDIADWAKTRPAWQCEVLGTACGVPKPHPYLVTVRRQQSR